MDNLQSLLNESETTLQILVDKSSQLQKLYREDAAALKSCAETRQQTQQILQSQLDERIIKERLQQFAAAISHSWTSSNIQKSLDDFFQDMLKVMSVLQSKINAHKESIHAVYNLFQARHHLGLIEPQAYSMQPSLDSLKQIAQQTAGIASTMKLITHSSRSIRNKFEQQIALPCTNLLTQMHRELNQWLEDSVRPLDDQIEDQRYQLDKILNELKTLTEAREKIKDKTGFIKQS